MANPKKGTSQARNEFIWGWAFILPTMLGLIILNIYPIFKTIYESFFKTGDFGKGNIFIGFDNYVKLFHDAEVWQALLNTFKYAIVEVPFSIAIALVLAVLLNRKMKGRAVYRTIFFLPMVAAPAAAEEAAGPSEVTVTLTNVGGTKVAVIKAVREITGLGLVDAKKLVDGVPAAVKENVSPEEAESIKEKLVAAGATVEIK